ncbi:MAG: sigma-70 family RNA polymerase sigma factor [Deltaproteobacteria bacterium]|nr:sigma-70 family RNA polymerase sigma factor [Deltaproteobacteria bacterium]
MTTQVTDTELVASFQDGDIKAFEELVERYVEKVHRLAWRISRLPEDAEDILQDVFISVFTKIKDFQGRSAFSSWLYRITANTAFMNLRKRKKHSAIPLEEAAVSAQEDWSRKRSDTSDIAYLSSRHELRAALQNAIDSLPAEYKAIFILRDMDGLSNGEVGDILRLSVPAVKSRLHRSRLLLRKKLRRFNRDWTSKTYLSYGVRGQEVQDEFRQAA